MTAFEKELVRFVSGYLDAGVSAEDYVKAFSKRLLDFIGRQIKPKVSEDVETEALRSAGVLLSEHFEDEDDDAIRTTALRCWKGGVIHGASWQKEQMMKEAVEGEVYLYHSYNRNATAIVVDIPKENLGDNVRIIIVKEDHLRNQPK